MSDTTTPNSQLPTPKKIGTEWKRLGESVTAAVARVKTIFEPPLGANPKPIELRERILDDIERRVEPSGHGRRVLPFNRIHVTLLAPGEAEEASLRAALTTLPADIRTRLREIRCDIPAALDLNVDYVRKPKRGWAADQRLAVECSSGQATGAAPSPEPVPPLEITIVKGTATQATYAFADHHVRIGRTVDPVDDQGRPRHNHVVFVEGDDEHSRTVGRGHASIRYRADRREFRLFDDGSHNGTRIVRNGIILDVAPRDPVGVCLISGDRIQLGTALLEIRIGG